LFSWVLNSPDLKVGVIDKTLIIAGL